MAARARSQVDGTLVNSQQQLTPGVEAAVRRAHGAGVPVRRVRSYGVIMRMRPQTRLQHATAAAHKVACGRPRCRCWRAVQAPCRSHKP